MRADLAPIALTALFGFAGLGVLAALDFVKPSLSEVLGALGLAYLVGVGAVLLPAIGLLTLGVAVRLPGLVALCAAIGLAGIGVAARRRGCLRGLIHRPSWSRRGLGLDVLVAAVFLVTFGMYAVLGFQHASVLPLDAWDAWAIWTNKAVALVEWGGLRPEFFASPAYSYMHLDYPVLMPLYEAIYFRAAGTVNTQAVHVHFWTLLIAFVWAAGFIASRVTRPALWAPILVAFALAPGVSSQLLTLYADVPVAIFLCIGILLLGLWLSDRRPAELALATLFLATAANIKNEGLVAGLAALVVLALVVVVSPPPQLTRVRALGPALAALAGFIVGVLPWRIWMESHHITGDLPVRDALDPSFLWDRSDRVWPSIEALAGQLVLQERWFYVVPLALAVVAVCLAIGVLRQVAAFYLLTGVMVFAGLIWAYWISPNDLGWHLSTSVDRVATSVVFVGLAALLHLSGALERVAPARDRAKSGAAPMGDSEAASRVESHPV